MKIELRHVKVRDLVKGYTDNQEGGVVGYNGSLNIRPPYQREYVYKDKQRDAVVETVQDNCPLSIMFWVVSNTDRNKYEVLDGQQRTISICQYINSVYSIDHKFFHNLTREEQDQILDYELMVYFCEGSDQDKIKWFKKINIAGVKLNDQELRNSIYTGPWLSDARAKFSKTKCSAHEIGKDYMSGSPINQDYLKEVLSWISDGNIESYMAKHQHDKDASELWEFFVKTIAWVKKNFPITRTELMKGVKWGSLYKEYQDKEFDPDQLEIIIKDLILDDDVTQKKGIYYHLLTGDVKPLSIRSFPLSVKQKVFTKQDRVCVHCKKEFEFKEMEADHITPWSEGGQTIESNCQLLCKMCNRTKSNK